MTATNQTITHPLAEKRRITFRKTAAQTDGQLLEMEACYAPEGAYPPEHYHPRQDEHFEVLQGQLSVRLNGREYTFRAGQTIEIPRGTVHSMRNGGATEAVVIWQVRPALKTQTFYETLFGLAADGRTDRHGRPNLLQLAVLMQAYREEMILRRPAPVVQKLVFGPLALAGRLLGYRARYDQYSGPAPAHETWKQAEATVWIDQTPEEVFRFIANFDNDTGWRRDISSMSQSPTGQTGVGTTTCEELDFLGRHYTTIARVTGFEPGKRLVWTSVEATTPVTGWRMVEPEGRGTRFSEGLRADLQGIYRWLSPVMVGMFQKQMDRDVARLKQVLEQRIG